MADRAGRRLSLRAHEVAARPAGRLDQLRQRQEAGGDPGGALLLVTRLVAERQRLEPQGARLLARRACACSRMARREQRKVQCPQLVVYVRREGNRDRAVGFAALADELPVQVLAETRCEVADAAIRLGLGVARGHRREPTPGATRYGSSGTSRTDGRRPSPRSEE